MNNDEDKVCFHHEKKYLYQTRQIQFANPFGRHSKCVISKLAFIVIIFAVILDSYMFNLVFQYMIINGHYIYIF